jgi:hypothetical protein
MKKPSTIIAGGFGSTGSPLRVVRGVKELLMTLQPLRQLRLAQLPLAVAGQSSDDVNGELVHKAQGLGVVVKKVRQDRQGQLMRAAAAIAALKPGGAFVG